MSKSGVYKLFKSGVVVYVGQSVNANHRIATHKMESYIEFDDFEIIPCRKKDLDELEKALQAMYSPRYNLDSDHYAKKAAAERKRRTERKEGLSRECGNCGVEFKALAYNAKFCSSSCRVANHLKKRIANGQYVSSRYLHFTSEKITL